MAFVVPSPTAVASPPSPSHFSMRRLFIVMPFCNPPAFSQADPHSRQADKFVN